MLKSLFDYLEHRVPLDEWNKFVGIHHQLRHKLNGLNRTHLANALLAAVGSRNPTGNLDTLFTEIQNWKYGNYNPDTRFASIDDSDLFAAA